MGNYQALTDAPAWFKFARCRGAEPGLFFPYRGEDSREAKKICDECSVSEECLEFGMDERYGVWGGKSERERRRLRRSRPVVSGRKNFDVHRRIIIKFDPYNFNFDNDDNS